MKIWPPFVLISLRKEHFYGNAAAELRALFKRVKWCMLWPKDIAQFVITLKDCLIIK